MTSTLQALLAETSFDFDGTWLARCQQCLLQLLLLLLCLCHRWVAALYTPHHMAHHRNHAKQEVVLQYLSVFSQALLLPISSRAGLANG